MNNDKALTIYKASAGSGKTFTLSVKYIELLIKNPLNYRSTLAVTFTNKATEEMKIRILSQLYGIWKQLPDSKDYIDRIKKDLELSEQYIAERAGIALHNIVHNYSYFRIETIDSFFQSILRNLARELDLTANLRVELNDKQIEENAVDELIDNLNKNDKILKWIMEYVKENIDNDKNWNVIGQIKRFGENIFKEFYKTNSKELNERLTEKGFFTKYKYTLYKIKNGTEERLKEIANNFFDELERFSVNVDDLKYKEKGPASYFIKLKKGIYDDSVLGVRAETAMVDHEKWASKTAPDHIVELSKQLTQMLYNAEEERRVLWKKYGAAVLTLRHLNQLRLLYSIEQKVREMNVEANRFLLSDTHTLLHSLIKDTDSPFIFEKIGTRLKNIMIDEFQDTSVIQWQNFKVLLEECMSHSDNGGSLIVGDVKQSIYRWRSGDWRMLNNIEDEFPNMGDMLNVEPLKYNYRSTRRVVDFNNKFFECAADIERIMYKKETGNDESANASTQQLQKAYEDVIQEVPEDRPNKGYVSVELLSKDNCEDNAILKCTAKHIEELLKAGATPHDIAIIVRSNKNIQQIADYFATEHPNIKLVSDEAFRLDSSVAVCIIIGAMQVLYNNNDVLTKAFLAKAYRTKVLGEDSATTDIMLTKTEGIEQAFPKAFRENHIQLLSMPLYELAEKLYDIFELKRIEGEDAYIFAFYDYMNNFLCNNTADIGDFINEWNSSLYKKTIQANTIDGIRLLTIHKSKGLEYEHVLLPFCDWKMEQPSTIWCSPTEEPFNGLPLVPIDYQQKLMKGTIYEADYNEEHLQNSVDNLNILYVAFTRAANSLFVIGQRGNIAQRSFLIEQVITSLKIDEAQLDGDYNNLDDSLTFTYGELEAKHEKRSKQSDNIFKAPVENVGIKLETYNSNVAYRQSNRSNDFVSDNDDDDNEQQEYIKTGRLLHHLFATIRTKADIEPSIREMVLEGLIDSEKTASLQNMLNKRFESKQVADWFSERWTLFNECSILWCDATTGKVNKRRPDRVMKDGNKMVVVDFKFGKPKDEYRQQVAEYMALIKSMGYNNVSGYLWYVYPNKIEEIA